MKTYYISTWGGGTPEYLVSAETKERAWQLVEAEWFKTFGHSGVGSDYYNRNDKIQTINDLIELPGFNNDKEIIIDLMELSEYE